MWSLRNNINKVKQKQTHRYRKQIDGCQRGGEVRRLGEKIKGIKKCKLIGKNSHRGVKYSTGNTVNNIVILMYGARRVLEVLGGGGWITT